jgi:proline dehydrogenase
MSLMRSILLAASQSRWLRERAPKLAFVRHAVARFMPGEELDDMLRAAQALAPEGIHALFTRLGENVTDPAEADAVARHYLGALERVSVMAPPPEPSVKLTQLGLDLDRARCYAHLRALATRAHAGGNYLWIDMEQSAYVDVTLDLTRRLRAEFPRIGVCLQAYLYRTADDLTAMIDIGAGVRLVKGAYSEPRTLAFPKKADVDENYRALADAMLGDRARAAGVRAVFGTHDVPLVERIRERARSRGLSSSAFEVHMLYGIQREAQVRLAREGVPVRVLVAYGAYWFPWYMRRLAERPANVGFVLRSLLGR